MPRHVLVLDPPGGELDALARAFAAECEVGQVASEAALLERLDDAPDLVVLDFGLGDGVRDGRAVLAAVRARDAVIPVVVVAEEGGVDVAAEVVEAGATDFLVRSGRLEERVATQLRKIRVWVQLIDRNRALSRENRALRGAPMVGESPELRAVIEQVRRVARIPRPVLVLGERGSGKELVARALHESSDRAGPFVIVNCAAVPPSLLEAELFGHERGAFTGAERRTEGKFEAATGGTLFLDEIGHMSVPFQTKILRAVEYGAFLRVGGAREVQVDTRIVAATNADLRAMIDEGRFLPDLYDRLAFEEIRVPPLRERVDDVEVLAEHFMQRFMREVPSFRGKTLSPRAREALRRYPFPGNVRELKNMIERAVYREVGAQITPEDLGLDATRATRPTQGTFKERLAAFERDMIEDALEAAGGNQAEAARRLGLTYDQFRHYRGKHPRRRRRS
ncbi:MAG: sigma-54-dependent Fis family transcriptional regulator [Sandaracinaceae bacterium]|nr:sigma-54-dependent Fis family transcriptional regulator [Sandaracinaceae bacterium]